MFYSQFILAKKGPLGTIWIAAHLERKLRKNQVADTDIGVSVDSILFPEVPIALRLSSHLLLGVVRIYNRKVNYLFDDCSEALLKVKQAFRSTAVDLPPEESKAPYHSITLPETFDLDDFELPDSDIYQGNYVDHHISSREQITLQDNIEGASYSTSKFGLDERFGDGDTSGLDLDEELFLDKIGSVAHADESADPQGSFGSMSSLKQAEHPEDRAGDSETMVDVDGDADIMDYAPGPPTPGLVEEPNLSTIQEASAYEEHMESEYHAAESSMRENEKSHPDEDKQEVDWCSHDHTISEGRTQGPPDANENKLGGVEIEELKPERESLVNDELVSLKESSLVSEAASDLLDRDGGAKHSSELVGWQDLENLAVDGKTNEIALVIVPETSCLASVCEQSLEGVSTKDLSLLGVDIPGSEKSASNVQKFPDASALVLKNQAQNPETEFRQENANSSALNLGDLGNDISGETPFLRPCSSIPEQTDVTKSGCNASDNADVQSYVDLFDTFGKQETAKKGEESSITGTWEEPSKENQGDEPVPGEHHPAASTEPIHQINITNSPDGLAGDLKNTEEPVLPDPEKMLSVPVGHVDHERDMLVEVIPREFGMLDEGDAGSKTVTGKKRSFTESTLTEQSLNSVESSRHVRGKRTVESVPDDNDLLSSILVGRVSSVLKVKPTPPISEVTSVKRTRTSLRSGALKRKVLIDDTMVLHGDTIRQQLMNTEDIRRVRKKAPCTRPEIRMIQIQHVEDDFFLESVFPGMSVELASLHNQVYDLNQVRICQYDATNSPKIVVEPTLPSENEAVVGTKLTSPVENNDVPEPHQVSHDIKNDEWHDKTNTTTENGLGMGSEHLLAREEAPETVANPTWGEDRLEEVNASQEQINGTSGMGVNVSQKDLLTDVVEVETSKLNAGSVNPAVISRVEPLDFTGHAINDADDASAHMVQAFSLHNTDEPDFAANAIASDVFPCQNQDISALELDFADNENGQPIASNNTQTIGMVDLILREGETELVTRDDAQLDVAKDGTATAPAPDADHVDLMYNANNDISDLAFRGQLGEFPYLGQEAVLGDASLNNDQNPTDPDVYQPSLMDPEISSFGMQDHDELSYLGSVNDTEFLNVDDDELNETAEDDMMDGEEARLTENTGWSSRTRAVSKYLQTTFMKEAEYGKKSAVSMDYLLTGKTRKEASRMFFETLVLKTRDYIHVEQNNPFGDIAIKPRSKLMKFEF